VSAAVSSRPQELSPSSLGGDVQTLRPLFGAVFLGAVWATPALAQRPLGGTVTDLDLGTPIASARVGVKGTGIGALTKADGRFTLTAPAGALTLEVRRIGYQSATVPVAPDQAEVEIKLKATALQLSEQVVTGQATTVARRNLANDVASLGATDVSRVHSQTIENALQGKVAGAIITANSGAPGGGLQVRMRGVTSVFGNAQPLYVVDGVPVSNTVIQNGLNAVTAASAGRAGTSALQTQDQGVNRIADLNPDDIERIEILKGPSAAAIYGSQAANGVVLITTRRGAPGETRFSVTQRVGTHALSNTLGARRFTLAQAESYDSAFGIDSAAAGYALTQQMYQASGGFQDVEQQVFGDKSLSYETDLTISGGNDKTQYFVSGLNQHDTGVMYGTGYDKQGLRVNLTQLVGSKLQVRANANFIHTLTKRGISGNDNANISPYFVISATPSFFSLQRVNGVYPQNPFLSPPTNPLQTLALFSLPEDVFRFIGSVDATYTFFTSETQSLRATLNAGLDSYVDKANIYAPATLYWEAGSGLPGLTSDLTGTETQAPVALTLAHTYTPASNAFAATTSVGLRSGYDNLRTVNVVTQNLLAGQQNVDLGTAVNVTENRQRARSLAMFAQEELLLLNERLFVSGGILAQKSTNNADVNKLFYYPKVAASYRWPTLGPFEELKVRAAFGETGNEPLYGQKFTPLNGLTLAGQNAVGIQGNLADPNLHPEREREIEGGLDAGLFNSRVAISATVYQKNITDLILQAAPASSMGYQTRTFNGGEIRNRGVEAAVSGLPVRTKDVSWLARVTFARNTGTVLSLPVPAFTPGRAFSDHFGQGFIQVGHSPSQIQGQDTTGVHRQMGDFEPKFVMGFSSEVTAGPFTLYGLAEWRHGGDLVNLTQANYDGFATGPDCTAGDAKAGCTVGAPAERLRLFGLRGSPYIEDASFVKLREITLSYQLPEHLVRSLFGGRVTGVRADLSGRNLATWTPYKGLDPEVSNFGTQNIQRGQDVTPYPPSRSYFFTLTVDF
jgi:TonB-linked SusC/RagA family outer membrane protein